MAAVVVVVCVRVCVWYSVVKSDKGWGKVVKRFKL